MFFDFDNDVDWEAYQEGYELAKELDSDTTKASNPYEKHTTKWYSSNRGWNAA